MMIKLIQKQDAINNRNNIILVSLSQSVRAATKRSGIKKLSIKTVDWERPDCWLKAS